MKRFIQKVKSIPLSGWVAGVFFLLLEYGMYLLGNFIARKTGTMSWAFAPKVPFIDDKIPFIGSFVIIYIYSYVFWVCGPAAVSLTGKKNFTNFCIALLASYFVGFLFFVFMPTYIDRVAEGVFEYSERPGVIAWLLRFIYSNDGEETIGYNLFPSYHCLISMCCYLGVRKRPEISKGYRVYSFIMTVLICMSTVFIKQHYFLDIVGGLAVPAICFAVVNKLDPASRYCKNPISSK